MSATKFCPQVFLRGEFVPFEKAQISIATQALHYGTGAFGGLRGILSEDKQEVLLFRLSDHAKRLSDSAKFLHYQLEPDYIAQKIVETVQKNCPSQDIYIRPLVYVSDLGISPNLAKTEKDLAIYGLELGDYLSSGGVKCCFSSWFRQEDRSFPLRGKISGAYITSALAKAEAQARGFEEAILFNTQGKISEASAMNIFLVKKGKLITPSVNQDILEGITRDTVLHLAQKMGLEAEERPVDKSELLVAEEVFLTGTAAKITPINQIENFLLPKIKPITEKLKHALTEITSGQNPDYEHWITRVKTQEN